MARWTMVGIVHDPLLRVRLGLTFRRDRPDAHAHARQKWRSDWMHALPSVAVSSRLRLTRYPDGKVTNQHPGLEQGAHRYRSARTLRFARAVGTRASRARRNFPIRRTLQRVRPTCIFNRMGHDRSSGWPLLGAAFSWLSRAVVAPTRPKIVVAARRSPERPA